MKIASVQQFVDENKSKNISNAVDAVKKAANNGINVICFAELAFTKFYPQKPSSGRKLELAETIPGPSTKIFCKLAKEFNIVIILNLFEKDDGKTYNSSPVINSDGNILGTTRMVHITDYDFFHEKSYYTPGNNGAPVYHTNFGMMGVAICYDRHYPEYMRSLALNGAEIVFIPQAGVVDEWPEGLYEAEMSVAAFQNGYFTALCNRVGKEERLNFAGESFVCNPAGNVIAKAKKGVEEILYCEVNLNEVKTSHARKLFLKDRRPELYKDWLVKK